MYYVYYLIDPRTNQPFYIGKGTGDRMFCHEKYCRGERYLRDNPGKTLLIREILDAGLKLEYKVVPFELEADALAAETTLISQYGKLYNGTGILTNLADGGAGGKKPHKMVHQYDLTGIYIRTFINAKEASEAISGLTVGAIRGVASSKGHTKSAAGYLWSYEKVDKLPQWSHDLHTHVTQYDKTGAVIATFTTIAEAGAATGVDCGNISACVDKKLKTAGGYVWRHGDDEFSLSVHGGSKAVMQLDKNTERVIATYSSATEAQRITGINAANISGCCSGKPKTAGGYKWKKVA